MTAMTPRRILVGVDGSDNARHALAWTIDLARALGAEIVAVHSIGLLAKDASGRRIPAAPHREEIAARFEQEWCAALDDAGVASRRVVRDGDPVSVVLSTAEELDADLLVLGSRGVGGFPEQLLGSTSHQVAERSARPVVIIPPASRTQHIADR